MMKFLLSIFTIVLIVGIENANCSGYEWTPENILFTSEVTKKIEIRGNETEYIVGISRDDLEEQVGERYSLYLWVEEMTCTKYTPKEDGKPDYSQPNYLIITSESKEVTIDTWRICDNITDGRQESAFNDIVHNLGLGKVKITPFGTHWSNETSKATVSVEIKKHKTIVLGDEIGQTDIVIIPDKIYSFELNKKDKVCYQYDGFDCSLTVAIEQECYASGSGQFLEISKDGGEKFTTGICNEASDMKFFESNNKIVLRSFAYADIHLTVTLVLNSTSGMNNFCPSDYFECGAYVYNKNTTKCIPHKLKCDGRKNCPSNIYSDENYDLCNPYYGCWGYDYHDGVPMITFLFIFLLIIVGLTVVVLTFRCMTTCHTKPRRGVVHDPMSLPPPTYDDAIKIQA